MLLLRSSVRFGASRHDLDFLAAAIMTQLFDSPPVASVPDGGPAIPPKQYEPVEAAYKFEVCGQKKN